MIHLQEYDPWSDVLGKFGAGLEKGFAGGFKQALRSTEEQRKRQLKNASRLKGTMKSHLGLYDKATKYFENNPDKIQELENKSRQLLEAGYEPEDAVSLAYEDILGSSDEAPPKEESQSPFKGNPKFLEALGLPPMGKPEELFSDIGKGLKKGGRVLARLASFPTEVWGELQKNKRAKIGKLQGLSDEEIAAQEKVMNNKTLLELYDELTGGEGKPENLVERLTQGLPFGVPGVAGEAASEIASNLNLPEWAQGAANLITFMTTHKMMNPSVKGVVGQAERIAETRGTTPEAVLEEAQGKTGVDLQRVIQGDEEAASALQEAMGDIPETTKKVKELPKQFFNKKAAQREREVYGAKLPESPLEYYYEVEAKKAAKEAAKKPETLAREAEIRERLAPEENKLFEDLRQQKDQLLKMQQEAKKAQGESKKRIETLRMFQEKKYQETLETLKDIQYEMRYGRPRPSEAEIDAQIKESVAKIEESARNPNEKTIKDAQHQLDLDKKYLDMASSLEARGELPGEIRPDTHIKMKEKYVKGYKAAIDRLKEEIQSLRGEKDSESLKKVADNKMSIKLFNDRLKRLNADIITQTDKIKSLRALEKPSGAFYKNQINSLKKDNALFRNDLFKQKKVKSPEELKTYKVHEKNKPQIDEGKKIGENPTKESIEKISKETGEPESKFLEALKTVKDEVKSLKKPIETGKVTPETINKFHKMLLKLRKRWKPMAKYAAGGFVVGAFQGAVEETLGWRPDSRMIRMLTVALGLGSFGATAVGREAVLSLFDEYQARELKKLKDNPREWNKYVNNIRQSQGDSKLRRVMKTFKKLDHK